MPLGSTNTGRDESVPGDAINSVCARSIATALPTALPTFALPAGRGG
jgi:hypothetical protein